MTLGQRKSGQLIAAGRESAPGHVNHLGRTPVTNRSAARLALAEGHKVRQDSTEIQKVTPLSAPSLEVDPTRLRPPVQCLS